MENKFDLSTTYDYSVINPENGEVVDSGKVNNLVTIQGREFVLNKVFKNTSVNNNWYIGIRNAVSLNNNAASESDTNDSKLWQDITDYFSSTKPQFVSGSPVSSFPNQSYVQNPQSILMINRSNQSVSCGGFFLTSRRSPVSSVKSIATNGQDIVAVLDDGLGQCLAKFDGSSSKWLDLQANFYNQINKVKCFSRSGLDLWVVVGSEGFWAYTSNPTSSNWTQGPIPPVAVNLYSCSYDEDRDSLFFVGDNASIYRYSLGNQGNEGFDDKETLDTNSLNLRTFYDIDIKKGVNSTDTRYIVVGGGGLYAYAYGVTSSINKWKIGVSGSDSDLYSVAFSSINAYSLIACGMTKVFKANWANWTASIGTNTLTLADSLDCNVHQVISLPTSGQWVICGEKGVSNGPILTVSSNQGTIATPTFSNSAITDHVYSICKTTGGYVYALSSGKLFKKINTPSNSVGSNSTVSSCDSPIGNSNFYDVNVLYGVADISPAFIVGKDYVLSVTARITTSGT